METFLAGLRPFLEKVAFNMVTVSGTDSMSRSSSGGVRGASGRAVPPTTTKIKRITEPDVPRQKITTPYKNTYSQQKI